MRTARCLVIVQVALLVVFFGMFGLIFWSMDEEVDVDVTVTCGSPIANISFPGKVCTAFAFGFVMNILLPLAS